MMFEMLSACFHTSLQSFAKSQYRFDDGCLRQIVPNFLQYSFQLFNVFRFGVKFVEFLKHCSPYMVIYRIQVWRIWWPGVLLDEIRAIDRNPILGQFCTMSGSAVLLKYEIR